MGGPLICRVFLMTQWSHSLSVDFTGCSRRKNPPQLWKVACSANTNTVPSSGQCLFLENCFTVSLFRRNLPASPVPFCSCIALEKNGARKRWQTERSGHYGHQARRHGRLPRTVCPSFRLDNVFPTLKGPTSHNSGIYSWENPQVFPCDFGFHKEPMRCYWKFHHCIGCFSAARKIWFPHVLRCVREQSNRPCHSWFGRVYHSAVQHEKSPLFNR